MPLDPLPSYQDLSEGSRQLFHHSLLVVENLSHLSDILMASVKEPRVVKWHMREVDALMDYLVEHHGEQGDGSFKDATFTAAAEHLKAFHVTGKIKDGTSLKNKWSTLPSNGLMREFRNTGWQYYDHFVQILPAGASSGVRTHRGTGLKTAMTANSTDSPDSQSLAIASSAPPYDSLRGDLPMAGSESVTLANTSSKLHASFPVPQSTHPPVPLLLNQVA
ncbi:hypothetical protein OG21DRAFT_1489271 [Imleria badia]|nr:hypothetical protein OG21DRAFT_1489271 [Imleria badia]